MINNDQNFEFLDIITIVSFMIQISMNEELRRQATNNDIIDELDRNIHELKTINLEILKILKGELE